jgi:hypothetical protein
MRLYFNRTTFEIDEKPESVIAAWEEAGNPKLNDWLPLPEKPTHDEAAQHAPVWGEGVWVVRDKTVEEIAAERRAAFPDAQKYQVVDWMTRAGIDNPSALIVAIITGAISDALERRVQINRWHSLIWIPRDHVLVNIVGAMLPTPLTPEQIDTAWADIITR